MRAKIGLDKGYTEDEINKMKY